MPRLARAPIAAALLVVAATSGPAVARGAEITVFHAALERVVWQVLLTEGGRGYLEGGPDDTCRYAFVQEPKVSGRDGRLWIRFVFSGRAGAEVAGRCVGPGDTFDLVVSGVPALSGGELSFDDLRVEAPDTAYFRLVRGLVESRLGERLRYPLRQKLDALAAAVAAPAGYAMSVDRVGMSRVQVDGDALRFTLDLGLDVR